MTMNDLATLGKFSEEDLAKLTVVELSALEAHVTAHNVADEKVESLRKQYIADLTSLRSDLANAKLMAEETLAATKKKMADDLIAVKLKAADDLAEASRKTNAEMSALKKSHDQVTTSLNSRIRELESLVMTLGGTELGRKMRHDAEVMRQQRIKADAEEALTKLLNGDV